MLELRMRLPSLNPLFTVILVPAKIVPAEENKFPGFQGPHSGCFANPHQIYVDFILPTHLRTS